MLREFTVAEQRFNAVMEVLRDGLTVIESAQQRWRALNAPHLVALGPGRSPVREGPPGRTSRRIRRRSASRMTRQSAGLDYCSCAREGAPDEC